MIKVSVRYNEKISKGHRPQSTCQRKATEEVRLSQPIEVNLIKSTEGSACTKPLECEGKAYLG